MMFVGLLVRFGEASAALESRLGRPRCRSNSVLEPCKDAFNEVCNPLEEPRSDPGHAVDGRC